MTFLRSEAKRVMISISKDSDNNNYYYDKHYCPVLISWLFPVKEKYFKILVFFKRFLCFEKDCCVPENCVVF